MPFASAPGKAVSTYSWQYMTEMLVELFLFDMLTLWGILASVQENSKFSFKPNFESPKYSQQKLNMVEVSRFLDFNMENIFQAMMPLFTSNKKKQFYIDENTNTNTTRLIWFQLLAPYLSIIFRQILCSQAVDLTISILKIIISCKTFTF